MLHLRLRHVASPVTILHLRVRHVASPVTILQLRIQHVASPGTISHLRIGHVASPDTILHLRVRYITSPGTTYCTPHTRYYISGYEITYEIRHNTAPCILQFCPQSPSILEYSSCLWSPYTIKHRALIENIQRRATKFILNYPPSEVSYLDRLVHLSPFA